MPTAAPRVVIDNVTLGFKCDEGSFDEALRNVLSLKWEGTQSCAVDAYADPAWTGEERRLHEDKLRVDRIIARHVKLITSSND